MSASSMTANWPGRQNDVDNARDRAAVRPSRTRPAVRAVRLSIGDLVNGDHSLAYAASRSRWLSGVPRKSSVALALR
jgi:hypothetical protein